MSGKTRVYLDYNATAPMRPEAIAAMTAVMADTGNPSSVHKAGRDARRRVEHARAQVAALVRAAPREVIFTGGGTEANNLAMMGVDAARILVSAVEHDAVLAAAHSTGARVSTIGVGRDGALDLDHLDVLLAEAPARGTLVSVMLANNETGVVMPIAAVAERARRYGAWLHCDAVQAAGKIPLDDIWPLVDLMTLSAHKMGGPQGVGALLARENIDLSPVLRGGGQERGLRAGTENVAGIAGFGAAAEWAGQAVGQMGSIVSLRDRIEARLAEACDDVLFHGRESRRLPNTSCIGMPGTPAETQVMALDLAGLAVSAGSACSSGKLRPSHVLTAMGHDEATARSAIRVSLGWGNAASDADRFADAWIELYRRSKAGRSAA